MSNLEAVNGRLRKGEGWIGYRNIGSGKKSRFLYYSFYRAGKQLFVNTKTNEPEEAYKQLLDARGFVQRGEMLDSEVKVWKYEDLIQKLFAHYKEHAPGSFYMRKNEDGSKEPWFGGLETMNAFFKKMPITAITATKIKEYVAYARKKGYSGPTIRRQLGRLRAAFYVMKGED